MAPLTEDMSRSQHENQMQILDSIVRDPVNIPSGFSSRSSSLILKLLDRNPNQRLGSRAQGRRGVRDYLTEIDFAALLEKRLSPPFVPKVQPAHFIRHTPYDACPTTHALRHTPYDTCPTTQAARPPYLRRSPLRATSQTSAQSIRRN